MNFLRAATVTLLTVPLFAQQPPQGQTTPGQPAQAQPTKNDAELVDRPETEDEKKQRLHDQVRKLEEEMAFLRAIEGGGGLLANVKRRLNERTLSPQQADDPGGGTKTASETQGAPAVPVAPVFPAKKARLLGDDEKKALPSGTIFTVDGLVVSEADFQEIYTYLRSVPSGTSEEDSKTQAVGILVQRKAAEATFADGAARARDKMVRVLQALRNGEDFAAVAKEHSDCPSKANGGDLGMFGRFDMDPHFGAAAFSLKDGEVSKIVQTAFGYHIIKRTGFQKGTDPAADRVRASHVLAMYHEDQTQVRGVANKVNQGQIDLGFVSDDWRKLAPPNYR